MDNRWFVSRSQVVRDGADLGSAFERNLHGDSLHALARMRGVGAVREDAPHGLRGIFGGWEPYGDGYQRGLIDCPVRRSDGAFGVGAQVEDVADMQWAERLKIRLGEMAELAGSIDYPAAEFTTIGGADAAEIAKVDRSGDRGRGGSGERGLRGRNAGEQEREDKS